MSDIKFFNIDPMNIGLANNIVHRLGTKLSAVQLDSLFNGEVSVYIEESVRDKDVYILSSFIQEMGEMFTLLDILHMVEACKLGAASRVTAVIPYFPNVWQDVADDFKADDFKADDFKADDFKVDVEEAVYMLCASGVDRIITMDCKMGNIPVDNLSAEPAILSWIKGMKPEWGDCCIVSLHARSVKRAITISDQLGCGFAILHNQKLNPCMETLCTGSVNQVSFFVGDVKDRTAIIIDEIAGTYGRLVKAADKLKKAGANQVYAIVTHGIFSEFYQPLDDDPIDDSCLDAVFATNTRSQVGHMEDWPKIQCIDVSKILADAIQQKF